MHATHSINAHATRDINNGLICYLDDLQDDLCCGTYRTVPPEQYVHGLAYTCLAVPCQLYIKFARYVCLYVGLVLNVWHACIIRLYRQCVVVQLYGFLYLRRTPLRGVSAVQICMTPTPTQSTPLPHVHCIFFIQ